MYYEYKRDPALVDFWRNKSLTFLKEERYESLTEYLVKIFTGNARYDTESPESFKERVERETFYDEGNIHLQKEIEEEAIKAKRYLNGEMDYEERREYEAEQEDERVKRRDIEYEISKLEQEFEIELTKCHVNFAKDVLSFIESFSSSTSYSSSDIVEWQKYLCELFLLLNTIGTIRYTFRHLANTKLPNLYLPELNFVSIYLSKQSPANLSLNQLKVIKNSIHK